MATQIKIGKAYVWSNGTIVFCTDWNLETFSGVVIVSGPKAKGKENKVGFFSNGWNADGNWKPLKGAIKLPEL